MAFLGGADDFDSDGADIAEQPTEPMTMEQLLEVLHPGRIAYKHQQQLLHRFETYPRECPLCCMQREEESGAFLTTAGALLLLCEYHSDRIAEATNEELEVWAPLIHVAWLRYAWPPGY
jgi:hypothetical protein